MLSLCSSLFRCRYITLATDAAERFCIKTHTKGPSDSIITYCLPRAFSTMEYHIFISITHILCNIFSTNSVEIPCAGFKQSVFATLSRCFPRVFHSQMLPEMQYKRINLSRVKSLLMLTFSLGKQMRLEWIHLALFIIDTLVLCTFCMCRIAKSTVQKSTFCYTAVKGEHGYFYMTSSLINPFNIAASPFNV